MSETTYATVAQQYEILVNDVKAMEPSLKLLFRNYLLMEEKGYRFSFAVDFHEIWRYADPLSKFMQASHGQIYPDKDDDREKQIARGILFYGLEPGNYVVLLPPYVIELNDKIAQITPLILKKISQIDAGIVKKLNDFSNDKFIRQALEEFKKTNQLSTDVLKELRSFFEKRVGDLLFLISGVAGQGIRIIQNLLSGEKSMVRKVDSRWPEMKATVQEVLQAGNSGWFSRFMNIRSSERYQKSNMLDAKAIDLVLALNQRLVDKHEVVIIVSDTDAMKEVLTKAPFDSDGNLSLERHRWTPTDGLCIDLPDFQEPLPLFQPLEMFYYDILFRGETRADTLKNIKEELERIDQAHMLTASFEELKTQCKQCVDEAERTRCEFAAKCSSFQKELSNIKQHFDQRKNVLLTGNRLPIIQPYWDRIERQKDEYEQKLQDSTMTLIRYLSEIWNPLDNGFRDWEKELLVLMEEDLLDALGLITEVTSIYREEPGESVDKFTRTHYRIHFQDTGITKLLETMEQARYAGNSEGTFRAVMALIERGFKEKTGPERSLIWAVLLLIYRMPERTVRLATRILHNVDDTYRPEYLYIRALAHCEAEEYADAVKECESILEEDAYKTDARFYHLVSLAMGLWRLSNPNGCEFSWDPVIDYARKAYDLTRANRESADLHISVTNNLAYLHSLRKNPGDLEIALGYLHELQDALPSDNLGSEFLHTRGCVLWGLALDESDREIRRQKSMEALEYLLSAWKLAQTTGVDPKSLHMYEDDYNKADYELASYIKMDE